MPKIRRSEIRVDPLTGGVVVVSPTRGKRPKEFSKKKKLPADFFLKKIMKEKALLLVGTKDDWKIKVVANKFPAFTPDNPRAYGKQELVVETQNINKKFADFSVSHITKIIDVYAQRTEVQMQDPRVGYVLIFRNEGEQAGATFKHAHSQIYATEIVPPSLIAESHQAAELRVRGVHPLLARARKDRKGPRHVWSDDRIVAFCPKVSRFRFETWITSLRAVDNITDLSADERLSLAQSLKHVLGKIKKLRLPYNYYFHQMVRNRGEQLVLKITPRASYIAGFELDANLYINPVPPEDAAAYLRI